MVSGCGIWGSSVAYIVMRSILILFGHLPAPHHSVMFTAAEEIIQYVNLCYTDG